MLCLTLRLEITHATLEKGRSCFFFFHFLRFSTTKTMGAKTLNLKINYTNTCILIGLPLIQIYCFIMQFSIVIMITLQYFFQDDFLHILFHYLFFYCNYNCNYNTSSRMTSYISIWSDIMKCVCMCACLVHTKVQKFTSEEYSNHCIDQFTM